MRTNGHTTETYPVFYLVSGTTDTEETWFKVGRVNFILDNLIARKKAAPSGVTVPLDWLGALIEAGRTDDAALLAEIDGAMPHETVALRERAAEVTRLLVERLEKMGGAAPGEGLVAEQGRLANNLSVRLSGLGRREEALAQAQEAVRLYGQLAQGRPDAFLPDLAMSCGARGSVLVGMGRYSEGAASFAEGVHALTSPFQTVPAAFASLMASLSRSYLQALEQAGQDPDMELLAPVAAVFEKLNPRNSTRSLL